MVYAPHRCGTLLIPTGPTGDHLFVITTDICVNGRHLLANVSTIHDHRHHDDTCTIAPGEHPFINGDSYVVYRMATIGRAERLTRMVDGWMYKAHDDASDALTQRIFDGFEVSRFTPRRIKDYIATLG